MQNLLKLTSEFVSDLLKNNIPDYYTYHNYQHTCNVVNTASEIGKNSGLTDEELEILLIAAWFHDTGFVRSYKEHEEESIKIANDFLIRNNVNHGGIEKVTQVIHATKTHYVPQNLIEQIIKDADLSYLGKKKFYKRSLDLKKEWELVYNKNYTDYEWIKQNIEFLLKNKFYTIYSLENFEEQKQKNIDDLKKRLMNSDY